MLAAEIDNFLIERQIHHKGGRVGREVQNNRTWFRDRVFHRAMKLIHKAFGIERPLIIMANRDMAQCRACDDESECMDRIGRVGHQKDIAGACDRRSQVCQSFLGTKGHNGFSFRINIDAKATTVIGRQCLAQAGNAARHRIAMGARVLDRFNQLVDDMLWGRRVRVAHAEIDNVLPRSPRRRLHRIYFCEYIRR